MLKSTAMQSLGANKYCPIYYYYSASKMFCQVRDTVVTLSEDQGHRTEKRLYIPLVGLSHRKHGGHCLNSLQTSLLYS